MCETVKGMYRILKTVYYLYRLITEKAAWMAEHRTTVTCHE